MKTNKLLLLAIILIGFNVSAQLPGYVPSNGLVGWWPFSGNADDLSPNVYNGMISGVTPTVDRFGNPNSAYSFDGVNDQIVINAANIGSGDFSISGWFKTGFVQTGNTYQQIFMAGYSNSSKVTELMIANYPSTNINNQLTANIRQVFPNDNLLRANDSVVDNTWRNFIIIKTSTTFKLYLNGVLANSIAHTASDVMDVGTYTIGNGQGNVSNRWFHGSIDDIGFWNRTLTEPEITALVTTFKTGLQSELTQAAFNVWPNPANDFITINNSRYSALNRLKVSIYNTIGQEVYASAMSTNDFKADISHLGNKGIYILKIMDDQNSIIHTQKILVK
jgi:hypothetical protein